MFLQKHYNCSNNLAYYEFIVLFIFPDPFSEFSAAELLGLLIKKLGNNLQSRCHMEAVLKKTLQIFHQLAEGISIVQKWAGLKIGLGHKCPSV